MHFESKVASISNSLIADLLGINPQMKYNLLFISTKKFLYNIY